MKKFPSSRKNYERSKTFCVSKGGVLVEIKGPKDQQNVVDMLREVGDGDAVNYVIFLSVLYKIQHLKVIK